MKNKFDIKSFLPYIAAVIIFISITVVYFGPLWQGKVMKQHDLNTFAGMSKEIVDFRNSNNEEALWTNSMFGGMPAYQISVSRAENLIRYIDGYIFRLKLNRPADYVFLYMIGFFILMLVLGVDPWLSILAAVIYAFSSYYFIILGAGHNTKAHAIGYMAPTLAFVIYTFRTRKYLFGGTLFALFMALELYSNHPQITYYLGLIVLFYGIAELYNAFKEKEFVHFGKSIGTLVIALILAITVNSGNYWTTMEYSPYTIRGASELSFDKGDKTSGLDREYATSWSYGKEETLTLMIPNAKGGGSIPIGSYAEKSLKKSDPKFQENLASFGSYWGSQPMTSGPVYIGAIVVFLFVLGMFIVKGRFKWALFAVTLLSIFLAWGHNLMWFTDFFFDYVPGYNKFRTVSMILVIAELTMVIIAFLALNEIIKRPEIIKEKMKFFYISLALTAGLSLVLYLFPGIFSYLSDNDLSQLADVQNKYPQQAIIYQQLFDELVNIRIDIFTSDALRSFIFIILGAAVIFVYSLKKINKTILLVVMSLLMLTDIVSVDRRYINDNNYQRKTQAKIPYRATQANLQIKQDKDPNFRVFNTTVSTFNDASTSYYHKSIGGYHGAKLRRYQDVIEHHLSRGNMEVLNMLNTKYFIVGGQNGAPMAQRNPEAMGNAWFVMNKLMVSNPNQEINHIGKTIEITSIGDNKNLSIYGNPMNKVDTMSFTSPIDIMLPNGNSTKLDLSRLPIETGKTYIIGNNPNNFSPDFIDISKYPGGNLVAASQFKIKVIFDFDAKRTAVINKKFSSYMDNNKFNYMPSAKISLTEYRPNHLTYMSHATDPQLTVFSEIYYDAGWNVYIDGEKSEYIRANYILRAMVIPAGDHKIEWKFEPQSYFIGKKITFISSLILILLLVGVIVLEIKNNKNKED